MLSGRSTEQLREAEVTLRSTGAEVAAHAGDVGNPDHAHQLIEATVAAYGGIDVLVNNVGGGGGARIADSTDDDWHGALETSHRSPAGRRSSRCPVNTARPRRR
jgi:3-oxoacyl-[acyl-carrier protein] reductase